MMLRMFDTKESTSKTHAMGGAPFRWPRALPSTGRPGGHAAPLGIVPIFWT
jgi:hypothetical protein